MAQIIQSFCKSGQLDAFLSPGTVFANSTSERSKLMKLVVAIVQPERLKAVKDALVDVKVGKITVSNVIGCGAQAGKVEDDAGTLTGGDLLDRVRFEIAVNDDYVRPTVEAIIKGARTGHIGDGKIFILPMEECIRIRTGETGNAAIG